MEINNKANNDWQLHFFLLLPNFNSLKSPVPFTNPTYQAMSTNTVWMGLGDSKWQAKIRQGLESIVNSITSEEKPRTRRKVVI